VQRVGELVLVALRLGADRDGEHRLGRSSGSTSIVGALRREHVAGRGVVSLATAAMSPAATSVTVSCSLPRIVNSWCMRSSRLVRPFASSRRA
jgi:hypothetical protein